MSLPEIETGRLMGKFPFVRIGEGPQTLVIFPSMKDALEDVTVGAWKYRWACSRFKRNFTILLISRPHPLASGSTTRDMAHDCAKLFEKEIGPAHVLGISMGGLIAQHLAADFPQYVRRLALGVSACRFSTEGNRIVRHWSCLQNPSKGGTAGHFTGHYTAETSPFVGFCKWLTGLNLRVLRNGMTYSEKLSRHCSWANTALL